MVIRINDTTSIEQASVRLGGDGGLLMITIRNAAMTIGQLTSLLGDAPKIEVIADGFVTSVYRGLKLRTAQMETIGGVVTATISLQVERITLDEAQKLQQAVDRQAQTIEAQSRKIAELTETAKTQNEIIDGQSKTIEAQKAAMDEQGRKIAEQEKTIEKMGEAVTEAQKAAENAASALDAIEEGIASV